MRFKVFFVFFLSLSLGSAARAQVINAASCNQSDVQKAFSSLTSSTTTVNIPAGACTWTSTVTLSVPSGNTSLTVQGQTTCTGSGNPASNNLTCSDGTAIKDGMSLAGSDPPLLAITTLSGAAFRLTGLTITGTGALQTYNGAINIYGGSQALRVDHNHFSNLNQLTLNTGTGVAGVFDHNLMAQSSPSVLFHVNGASGSDWGGNVPWSQATALGSPNFVFFEDNEFVGGSSDCDHGGRWVNRFNTFVAESGTAQFQLTHPTGEPGGAIRGCRAWESYGNAFNSPSGLNIFSVWFLSSGTGVSWGNTINGTINNFFSLLSVRRGTTTYTQTNFPNGWGYCGTSKDGVGSPWDQNTNSTTGYRCLDQPGTGKTDLLTVGASFPTIVDSVIGAAKWPNQASEPIYEWMDKYSGNFVNNVNPDVLFNNSDFYLWCNASASTGCTSFDGTEGVGSGTLADRPSTCTTGVAYWATDQGNWNQSGSGGQGELFKCTATNTWTLAYTPYTYPHPLVSGTTTSQSGVPAPTGLTGTVVQ